MTLETSMAVETKYKWLEPKPYKRHTRQLGIKGLNMTVWNLVHAVLIAGQTPEFVSKDRDIPIEAIHEALAYYEENKSWIDEEVEETRRVIALRYGAGD
jgi:uncharacterized protein (DUF433 family)